ncbi:MAG: hypothetical protein AAFP84_12980, partial [Actinomycetota bacterium]
TTPAMRRRVRREPLVGGGAMGTAFRRAGTAAQAARARRRAAVDAAPTPSESGEARATVSANSLSAESSSDAPGERVDA